MKKHGLLWWLFIGWWWRLYMIPFRAIRAIIQQGRKAPEPTNSAAVGETHKVAGTSYRQEAIVSLGMKNPDFAKTKKALQAEGLTDEWIYEYEFAPRNVELQPEPDNPHDPKAIKVVVDGTHIGYIKAGSCAHIHKLLREDRILKTTCLIGGGKSKEIVEDEDDGRYVLEQDEIGFYARITITTKEA